MTKNVKKLSQEDYWKIIDEFLIKSVSIILQSRIQSNEQINEKVRSSNVKLINKNSFFLLKILNLT